ncbi:hypothetical protein Dsin_023358 [Dipteronia sinensis]|uniref:ABC transporter C family member 3-like n=1 Tax=Dipteronia sinensis TaxID=43782 RepID=A0AAE0E0P5_9ROSI|nr:hypothetical protein Dsin_023358 [Dipteronia sinensis]
MELFDSTKHVLSTLFTNPSSLMYSGTDFLLKPVFLRGFSGSLHLVLLLVLFVSWVCKKLKVGVCHSEESKERFENRRVLWHKLTLFCCLGVSVFNLVLCLLSYFYWYRNRWSDENLVTLLDLVLRTLGWGAICVYLQTQFFNSSEQKFPFLLRVWWGFYLCISCYCLVIDIFVYKKHGSLPIQYLVSDIVSVITGLFVCYMGFSGRIEGEDTFLLREPLLNGVSNGEGESIKSKGADNEVLLGLLRSKTVIYVTHQVEFLPAADLILASTDQSAVDLNIPYQVGAFAFSMIQLLGIIVVMSQVAWQVFLVFIPVIAMCLWYQQYYIPSARELSRLVGVCKAPVIQHFAETISGSTTIRSFDQEARFQDTNMKLMDGYSRPKFHVAGAMEWLCFRLDMLSTITFAFSLIFLISIPEGVIDPAIAGLAVTYGLNLNMLQAWVIWNLCNLENKIISVERMLQYTSIPSEPPLVIEENRPDRSWPSHGEVDIRDLQALDKCQLGDEVRKKEGKLDSKVTENGENWSMGQRQLVCLGRVLLKKSKVLVLDEATASVDTATDNLIQKTLRQHFTDCTVITIAHRITSVLDSDMVLLLSHGLIEEYDSPTKLLEDKSSSFAQLVAEYSARSNSSVEE